MQELEKGHENCDTFCAFSIDGPPVICLGSTGTYTISGTYPATTVVNWTWGAGVTMVSHTATTATFTGVSNAVSFVKAELVNPCGANFKFNMDITSGVPHTSYTLGHINPCAAKATSIIVPGTAYMWSHDGITFTSGAYQNCCIPVINPDEFFTLFYHNACGTSTPVSYATYDPESHCSLRPGFNSQNDSNSHDNSISVFPNPTKSSWHINLSQPTNLNGYLLDITGRRVWEYSANNIDKFEVPAEKLAQGVYFMELFIDGQKHNIKLFR